MAKKKTAVALRKIITNEPGIDEESRYVCSCGYDEVLSSTCECASCAKHNLPLERCPRCLTAFVIEEPEQK